MKDGSSIVPFLGVIAKMIKRGVEVRLIHAKEPCPSFRKDFDRYPVLAQCLERVLCQRVHFKMIIMDFETAYIGSANLTGAGIGIGMKGSTRRNFETGILTNEPSLVESASEQFDTVWRGAHCAKCGRKQYCKDQIKKQSQTYSGPENFLTGLPRTRESWLDHAALDADWMRLFYNLDSAYGIDNAGDISKALKDVETLFKSYLDYLKAEKEEKSVNAWLAGCRKIKLEYLWGYQWQEEITKAQLREKYDDWRALLEKAERQAYLDGQIGIALYVAGINIYDESTQDMVTPLIFKL